MAQASGSQSPPQFCVLNNAVYWSTDGGVTWTTVASAAGNVLGKTSVATTGATPSAAWPLGSDLLVATLGADVTSLTVTGPGGGALSLEADFEWEVSLVPAIGSAPVNLDLNGTTSGYIGRYMYQSSAGTNGGNITRLQLVDTPDANSTVNVQATISKVAGGITTFKTTVSVLSGAARFVELGTAVSTFTTDVSSIVLSGAMKANSVVAVRRVRPVNF